MSENEKSRAATAQPARKPYTSPRLTSYGHVKDIIQGATGPMMDAGGSGRSKSCWIAEVLYGIEDPRTLLLRSWVRAVYDEQRPGWPFALLYRTFGRATAGLIARGILPRCLFQPLFDTLVERAFAETAHALVAGRR